MRATPQRPPYDSLVASLIELRAALYVLERRKSELQRHYRRLGREADELIDNALEGADDRETAARFDGTRMRYTAPPSCGRVCLRRARPEQLAIGLSLSENRFP